jgi:uncharacterized membrane protein YccC
VLRETFRPSRKATLKLALSAFLAATVTHLLGLPSGGALFVAVNVSLQASSGTAWWKPLFVVAGLVLALAVMMLVITPLMPNLDDPGSFLVLAAIAFAPTVWLTIAGPRVRNGGFFGTVIVSISLFADFRPGVDLEAPTLFALGLAVGALVVAVVDRVVWPVDARRGMFRRAVLMKRQAAVLYRERDPRVVLSANGLARWRLHRHLNALMQLRTERVPLPGTPCFEPEEEALRLATSTQRLLVARIEEARRELRGLVAPFAEAERAAVAAQLDEQANEIEQRHGALR